MESTKGRGLVAREAKHVLRGTKLLVPLSLDLWGRESGEGGWRLIQSPVANDLTDHAYVIKPP